MIVSSLACKLVHKSEVIQMLCNFLAIQCNHHLSCKILFVLWLSLTLVDHRQTQRVCWFCSCLFWKEVTFSTTQLSNLNGWAEHDFYKQHKIKEGFFICTLWRWALPLYNRPSISYKSCRTCQGSRQRWSQLSQFLKYETNWRILMHSNHLFYFHSGTTSKARKVYLALCRGG